MSGAKGQDPHPSPGRERGQGDVSYVRELERMALRAWPAIETARIGRWEVRFSGGFTKRANSVQPIGAAEAPYYDRVFRRDEVHDLVTQFGLRDDDASVPYDRYWETDFELYIEVQLWDEPPLTEWMPTP